MRDLIRSYGIQLALYSDRHGVFKHTPPSEAVAAPTQFSRAMGELGVQLIFARSPQAKGRVERTAGTLQDRLVTELRLAGATTVNDANRVLNDFLPRFNVRFGVPSQHADTAYRVLKPVQGRRVGAREGRSIRVLAKAHVATSTTGQVPQSDRVFERLGNDLTYIFDHLKGEAIIVTVTAVSAKPGNMATHGAA